MRFLFALLAGSLFGLGLIVSGMTDTTKVRGFLDIFGAWDPTLVFVMGGAIVPMFIAWRIADKRRVSLTGTVLPALANTRIDPPLIVGGVLFGAGWGLAGFCPGPALASATFGGFGGLVFLASMGLAMVVARPVIARLAAEV